MKTAEKDREYPSLPFHHFKSRLKPGSFRYGCCGRNDDENRRD